MKSPSKNISASLRGQSAPGRSPIKVEMGKLKGYGPSMTVPGEGGVEKAPAGPDRRGERSAAHFADAASRKVGG